MPATPVALDGTEQHLYSTPFQFAAGSKVVATGYIRFDGDTMATPVDIQGRVRVNGPNGPVVGQFTATVGAGEAVRFAFSGSSTANPVPAVRVWLSVQSAGASGITASGFLDIEVTA